MKVNYIFANKMVELSSAISLPVVIEIHAFAIAEIFKAGHIADWRIQPHIKVLARRIGNLKAKVRSIATDIPLLQAAVEPLPKLVGHFFLHRATARPVLQKLGKLRQLKEIVGRGFFDGGGPRDRRHRIDQINRRVGCTAGFAVIAVLIFGFAFRAAALDIAVRQKQIFLRIKSLSNLPLGNMAIGI